MQNTNNRTNMWGPILHKVTQTLMVNTTLLHCNIFLTRLCEYTERFCKIGLSIISYTTPQPCSLLCQVPKATKQTQPIGWK